MTQLRNMRQRRKRDDRFAIAVALFVLHAREKESAVAYTFDGAEHREYTMHWDRSEIRRSDSLARFSFGFTMKALDIITI